MVEATYPEIMGFEILKGRFFDSKNRSDYLSYIVNETFIRQYQIQDISRASLNGSPIIGVIKDFHYNSLHNKIGPLAIRNEESYQSRILIELRSSEIPVREVIDKIIQSVDEIDNTAVSDVNFLNQHIAKLYEKEKKILNILFVLALFSILISGMGLFSMSVLITKIRTKEIGIRKVNGATTAEVMIMLYKEFAKWIAIASIIAIPIAYYAMKTWLANFEYKTNISGWIFVLSGMLALGIALLTVSWQSWRVAARNPVVALRYE
jgi:putative ABC transport system permease protein